MTVSLVLMTGGGSATCIFHLKGDVAESYGLSFPSRGNSLLRAEVEVTGRGFFHRGLEVSMRLQESY